MALEIINNGDFQGDTSSEAIYQSFEKTKNNFATIEGYTGGAHYIDNVYTSASPLSVSQGSRVKLTNNKNTIINLNAPTEFIDGLWDNDKLVGINNLDIFDLEIRFKAKSSVKDGLFDIELEIPTIGVIDAETESTGKSANTEQRFSAKFKYYTRTTFIANGCEIYFKSDTGNISIYDIQLIPSRTHKGY